MIVGELLDQHTLEGAIEGCDLVYNYVAVADLDEALSKPVEIAELTFCSSGFRGPQGRSSALHLCQHSVCL